MQGGRQLQEGRYIDPQAVPNPPLPDGQAFGHLLGGPQLPRVGDVCSQANLQPQLHRGRQYPQQAVLHSPDLIHHGQVKGESQLHGYPKQAVLLSPSNLDHHHGKVQDDPQRHGGCHVPQLQDSYSPVQLSLDHENHIRLF